MTNNFEFPILLITFNRLEETIQVFNEIKNYKPKFLYIASDGPRKDKFEQDTKAIDEIREFINSQINWNCNLKLLYRDKNLGCKIAVSTAISWFFEHEEMGIILEDDCLPNFSFFNFCGDMLQKYKFDLRIWHISGSNFQNGVEYGDGDYYYSKYIHVWGWATWADRWKKYDSELSNLGFFKKNNIISSIFNDRVTQKQWLYFFDLVSQNKIDTWDYQWVFTVWCQNGLGIIPNRNLIENIGFNERATHTNKDDSNISKMKRFDLLVKKHPTLMYNNIEANSRYYNKYEKTFFFTKAKSKLLNFLNNIK